MSKAGFTSKHFNDANGNPAGGTTFGNGFAIGWQNGPLGRHVDGPDGCNAPQNGPCVQGCTRIPPNGAFVEDVLAAVIDRVEYYQAGKFACERNAKALTDLKNAQYELNSRTREREVRKVEGTHGQ